MEKYVEFITNGLNLISFLLVTPEVLRVIAPTTTLLIGVTSAVLFALMMSWPFILLYPLIHSAPKWVRLVIANVSPVGLVAIVTMGGVDWTARVSDLASKHLLVLGVILFLISRLVAFYGSALKAGLL